MDTPMLVCECGSDEFVTKPNAYAVFKIINGKLSFLTQEFVEEPQVLYCRDCSKEYNTETFPTMV
ncbi:MAG: hypothetical protein PGMFKBFP_01637 [Anaerolineales bacterium]|nr:hypothetical protein [Anaerolineales bacterium]